MPDEPSRISLISTILEDQDEKELEEEEIIHLLLERKLSKSTATSRDANLTLGARMADIIAKFVGSWTFILIFIFCLTTWILLNALVLTQAIDPYPYILLNLILSCVAAIQAPVIMMSQNRQEEKDRLRSQNDYKTNLKSEIILEDLHQKIDQLMLNQHEILERIAKMEQNEKAD
ncbi:MAG: DUF1003 domain-containing protein [Candidatus Pelethousia sp.]|nr:DUF1003 domain-containing protein [Candidatus Pelethousia sp.]